MRLTLPERIPIVYAGLFAGLLFITQIIEGTGLYFSACSFLFILAATLAFNVAGGLTRPSGGYIFFFSMLAVIVGITAKAGFGERGDSNLLAPKLTMTAYLMSIIVMGAAAYLSRQLSRRQPLLGNVLTEANLQPASIGCLLVGTALTIATYTVNRGSGTVLSALIQVNRFTELAIILNVLDTVRRSGGRRSISAVGYIGAFILFAVNGLLGFSKEGMFTPIVCWFLACCAAQYRPSRAQLIGSVLGLYLVAHYFVPYSQYGRTLNSGNFVTNISVSIELLSNLGTVRTLYLADQERNIEAGEGGYFTHPAGLLDRLQKLGADDALIDATARHGPFGYAPVIEYFETLVPHVFWPGKHNTLWGNVYAHEAGMNIADDDYSTGISFSPTAEGYHLAEWTGILVLCPAIWLMAFLIFDSLCGDARLSPWSLLTLIYFSHLAPEGYLGGLIYAMFYFSAAIIFAALTIGYIMPVIGSLLLGRRSPIAPVRHPLAHTADELTL